MSTKKQNTPASAPAAAVTAAQTAPLSQVPVTAKDGLTAEQRADARAKAEAEVERIAPKTRPCGCGCGEQVTGRFRPGHDARLLSSLIKKYEAEAKAQIAARTPKASRKAKAAVTAAA